LQERKCVKQNRTHVNRRMELQLMLPITLQLLEFKIQNQRGKEP